MLQRIDARHTTHPRLIQLHRLRQARAVHEQLLQARTQRHQIVAKLGTLLRSQHHTPHLTRHPSEDIDLLIPDSQGHSDMTPATHQRPLDIVIYGATGFAGELAAEYLAKRHARSDLRWAIAGRSLEKLTAVRDRLGVDVPMIVADSADRASLDAMAAQTAVVCSTVGPYARYGAELVAACVANGTHYCDLTGEMQFVRRMADAHHEAAREAGVRIVHCCGFDSIPSDIGTWLLQSSLIERDGKPAESARFFLTGMSGGASGGTVASLLNVLDEASDPLVREVLVDPYSLNPADKRSGPDRRSPMGVSHDPVTGWWSGPFVMAPINARIVRRSNALLDDYYGEDFCYSEVTRTGAGVRGMISAGLLAAGMGAFLGAVALPPTRWLMEKLVLPAPGEGPSPEAIEKGYFKITISGRQGDVEVGRVTVKGRRDPGYGATACMLSEAAICLARDPLTSAGGVLTPASAMGQSLLDRLNEQDVQFTFEHAITT
jgi:short subunit dehydrogenase-like uncharacterized protein